MKSFAVIGCGRFGSSVATTLYKLGYDVLAIDSNEDTIQNIAHLVTKAVVVPNAEENALRELGLGNCDVVIVSIGSDVEASVITTLVVKEIGVPYILCKAGSEVQAKILYKIGADKVISPEKEMGVKVAQTLVSESILDKMNVDPSCAIIEIIIPKQWVGKTLMELDIRKNYSLNVIAIKKKEVFDIIPNPKEPLVENSLMLLIGNNKDLSKFEKEISENGYLSYI